ncbi:unnamed protein product [Urochloa humidicola]
MQEPGVAEKELSPANARHLVRQILCNRFTSKAAGGGRGPVHVGVRADGVHRRHQLLPQHGPELGAGCAVGGRQGDGAHQVHRQRRQPHLPLRHYPTSAATAPPPRRPTSPPTRPSTTSATSSRSSTHSASTRCSLWVTTGVPSSPGTYACSR